MAFFTRDYIDFFSELEKNNDRDWFTANKNRFKKNVEKPFTELTGSLISKFQKHDPEIVLMPKDAIFRIYRDVRFSADKSPYKTKMSAIIAKGGRKGMHSSGAYIEIGAEDASVYGGIYQPDASQLKNLREHIAANLSTFEKLIKAPDFVKHLGGEIRGEKNKRLPAELMEAAEKQPLLYNKAFYYFKKFPSKSILEDNFDDKVVEAYLAGKPLSDFLVEGLK